ncbi:uncharacterized protein FIBRA_09501 [Fibroporia radiculosa]|uniref:Uncharacterized protein n=1 Tax=Fibroporia radiculosa TaxID=599839 RepID=J7RHX7_9APHY|nr:uncharacterized protein FIBRA_09501 [Fibroporia radiculosa]CCM07162.1 predicted protein [Fibroporia radiculosa]
MVVSQYSTPSSETCAESHPLLSRAHSDFELAFEVLRLPTDYDYNTPNYICDLRTTPMPFDLCLRPALPLRRTPTRSAKSLEVPFSRPTLGQDLCARARIALCVRVVELVPLLPPSASTRSWSVRTVRNSLVTLSRESLVKSLPFERAITTISPHPHQLPRETGTNPFLCTPK